MTTRAAAGLWQGGAVGKVPGRLRWPGAEQGQLLGLAVAPGVGFGLAGAGGAVEEPAGEEEGLGGKAAQLTESIEELAGTVAELEAELRPRWAIWSSQTATALLGLGVRLERCWDVAAVHRLLAGGWRDDPARVWAYLHDLDPEAIPALAPPDLFHLHDDDGHPDQPVDGRGYLRADWVAGGWSERLDRIARWAGLAFQAAQLQHRRLVAEPRALATARWESTASLLCAELSVEGLPVSRGDAEALLTEAVGPPPRTQSDAADQRAARDATVLRWAPTGGGFDLRSPAQVRALLASVGIEVADTRAGRLRELRHLHPVVDALLDWRKRERLATTYGYSWLDQQLGGDGRLRGAWSVSDGAAGRMTASAGLHNLPTVLRHAVVAEPGQLLVRADLGQIEPRVLAVVSGDAALAGASWADDLYAPVADQLGVERATAKVAVLGAMYGQTTGYGAQALHRLEAAYPVAMGYLRRAERDGRAGRHVRTYGGRLVLMAPAGSATAAQGRYARNALIQGAAAELFKLWAVTVRARCRPLGARIVLCLHDELLLQVPARQAEAAADLVERSLQEAASRWAPGGAVRFVADTTIIRRWSEAKSTTAARVGSVSSAPADAPVAQRSSSR